jgi:ribonuclease P protein component
MPGGQPLGFGRQARIKQRRDFSRARQEGRRLTGSCLVANWRNLPPESRSRLGIITAARIGNAVSRNRTRRLLRETFRLHQHELNAPVDLVIVARSGIVGKPFSEVEKDLLTMLRKAGLLKIG